MSRSTIQEFWSNAQSKESNVGSQDDGTQTHSFNLFAVASYTIWMSFFSFGTAKNSIKDFRSIPDFNMYLRCITFYIFRLTPDCTMGSQSGGCASLLIEQGRPKKTGTRSLAMPLYRSGNRTWTTIDPALNLNQFEWVACQIMFGIVYWSRPRGVSLSPCFLGLVHQSFPYSFTR